MLVRTGRISWARLAMSRESAFNRIGWPIADLGDPDKTGLVKNV